MVQVWGCIGIGFRKLVVFPQHAREVTDNGVRKAYRLNAGDYVRRCLSVIVKDMAGKILIQDGAACHRSSVTQQYCARKALKVFENWPPRSPALNPIENMWAIVQRAVSDRGPRNREQLVRFVREEWDSLPQVCIDKMIRSFPGRLRKCVQDKGKLEN